jgi:transcriptional regulator with XRE-family HTH domain
VAAIGRELREARERRGLSVEQVAREARIPQRYVEALEKGDLSVFGRGPFASGYTRQYRKFLGLPEVALPASAPASEPEPEPTAAAPELTSPTVTSPGIPTGRRAVAMGVAVFVTIVLAFVVGRRALGPSEPTLGTKPDQVVLLTAAEPIRAVVTADGRERFRGTVPAGQQQRFEAHDELTIQLPHLDGVTLAYNGRILKPLGAQSRPRRLVFVDDRER